MPTTHTWKPTNSGFIYDPTNYTDGTAFAPGDTLVVAGGGPNAQGSNGNVEALTTGNYQFTPTSASTGATFNDMKLDAASTLSIVGPQVLSWKTTGQFINDGAFQIGSAAGAGSLLLKMDDKGAQLAAMTNTGSIALQNGSRLQTNILDDNDVILNTAGAVLSISSGSTFINPDPAAPLFVATRSHAPKITNNGLIAVNGAAGQATRLYSQSSCSGSGLLSIRGAPGDAAANTVADFTYGGASGTFDIASGTLNHTESPNAGPLPLAGTVNFLDNNGVLSTKDTTNAGAGTLTTAVINGFTAGDHITFEAYYKASGLSYDPATHKLTLTFPVVPLVSSQAPPPVQFTLAGNYTQGDFQIAYRPGPADFGTSLTTVMDITTTSTANAIPGFSTQDTATGAAATSAGQQYTGPVSYLQSQYIWASANGGNVAANMPNAFIGGNAGNDALAASAGSNVLDGGLGSNFLTGATGADGGRDTFFLDGSAGTTWDTVVNFHPGDSVTLWGFVPGRSTLAWAANEGAAGHTGATLHSAFAGPGTAVNGSVTFQGLSLADAQGKISLTPGSVGGRSYLQAHYNG